MPGHPESRSTTFLTCISGFAPVRTTPTSTPWRCFRRGPPPPLRRRPRRRPHRLRLRFRPLLHRRCRPRRRPLLRIRHRQSRPLRLRRRPSRRRARSSLRGRPRLRAASSQAGRALRPRPLRRRVLHRTRPVRLVRVREHLRLCPREGVAGRPNPVRWPAEAGVRRASASSRSVAARRPATWCIGSTQPSEPSEPRPRAAFPDCRPAQAGRPATPEDRGSSSMARPRRASRPVRMATAEACGAPAFSSRSCSWSFHSLSASSSHSFDRRPKTPPL